MDAKLTEKNWNNQMEKDLSQKWKEESLYKFNPNSGKEIYSIDTPPVYPSGEWHIGATAAYTLIDIAARYQRMNGKETLFPFGLDMNGIKMEILVEKKFKKRMQEYDREEFNKLCRQETLVYGEKVVEIAKRVGLSAEFDDPSVYYETDSPQYRAVSQACFIDIWKKGYIYETLRPNNYCPGCKTTIAEAQIEYKEISTKMNYLKWKVKNSNEEIEIGTTRPELLCACQAVLFNPEDERYVKLKGKSAILPIYGREIPIIAHPAAKMDFGSGMVMICSYGDTTDIQLFRELKLTPINAIDADSKMTEESGFLKGLYVKKAREAMIEKMKEENVLIKQEEVMHRTPTCEVSGDAIEFINLKEWYIKQTQFLEDIRKQADNMRFLPEKSKQMLLNWTNSITIDWPISRRRYYHTEIPLWYCKKCNEPFVPEPGPYYQPWKNDPPKGSKCKCGSTEFIGEERVFDTWVDSSISNLYVCGYKRNDALFEKAYPCSLRPQGKDIVRTWLFYTTLRNFQLTGKNAFENVLIHGMGLDEHGKKMSKSKGNVLHPGETLEKHGAEAFRFWAASETNVGEDFKMSEERMTGANKFLTKYWNTAKFISSFENKEVGELKSTDRWILSELNKLIKECKEGYEEYNAFIPSNKVKEFIWNQFASNYLEMVKSRAYEGDSGALYTLHTCLKTMTKLMAPITPFITDRIYRDVYGKTVHKEQMPEANEEWESKFTDLTQKIIDFNSMVWKTKKDKSISLNAEIEGIKIPTELKPFEEDLVKMHKLK